MTCVSQTGGPETVLAGEARLPFALMGFVTDHANGVSALPTPPETLARLFGESAGFFQRALRAALPAHRRGARAAGRDRVRVVNVGSARDLPPAHPRRPRLRVVPGRRRRRRGGGRRATRASRSTSTSSSRATSASASSTSSRPTPTPTTSRATGAWPRRPARRSTCTARPAPSTPTSPSTTAGSSRSASCGCARSTRRATGPSTPPSPWSTRPAGDEPWAVLTGDSLFVGRRRPPRPRGRARGGRARPLPQPHGWPAVAAARDRGLAGAPGRLDVRRAGHGPEDLLDHRLRAPATTRCCPRAARRASSPAALAGLGPQPPRFGDIVALNRGPLVTSGVRAAAALGGPGRAPGRARARWLVDVRTDLQFAEAHVPGAVLVTHLRSGFGTKLAWVAEPGRGDRLHRPRRRRRRCGPAGWRRRSASGASPATWPGA